MTKEQREFHERMNDAITTALEDLRAAFDIEATDCPVADWQLLRSQIKDAMLSAYARRHSWIAEP